MLHYWKYTTLLDLDYINVCTLHEEKNMIQNNLCKWNYVTLPEIC